MANSSIVCFFLLMSLLVSTMAQSPASAPSPSSFPPLSTPLPSSPSPATQPPVSAPSPITTPPVTAPSPATVTFSPQPSTAAPANPPSSISIPPSMAPGPFENGAAINRIVGSGSIVIGLITAALMM